MPSLVIRYPEKKKIWRVHVDAQSFTIGRSPEATVRLSHPAISKTHLAIECHGARCTFRDTGSHNGILVGGMRVERGALSDGDTLQLGPFEVDFWKGDAPPPDIVAPELPKPVSASALGETITFRSVAPSADKATPAKRQAGRAAENGAAKGARMRNRSEKTPPEPAGPPSPNEEGARNEDANGTDDGPSKSRGSKPARPRGNRTSAAPRGGRRERRRPANTNGTPGVEGARPTGDGPRERWNPAVLMLLLLICIAFGIGLGHIGSWLDGSAADLSDTSSASPASRPPRPGASGRGGDAREDGPAERPSGQRPDNPLGPRIEPQDEALWLASLVRLWFDTRDRPPLASELRRTKPLSLEDRWADLVGFEFEEVLEAEAPSDVFERMLRRAPTKSELATLLEIAKDSRLNLAFLLSSSHEYAKPKTSRARARKRTARSLLVDLIGRVPTSAEVDEVTGRLEESGVDIADVIAELNARDDSLTGPAPDEEPDEWVRDTYFRMLLRPPTEKEAREARAALRGGEEGWRSLPAILARKREYRSY